MTTGRGSTRGSRPTASPRVITPALLADALACIPADVDRDTWVRLAMACKAELGADGFDVWNTWSQQAKEYNAAAARDTWRSVKEGGRIKGGTLFAIAKGFGFRFPAPAGDAAANARPLPDAESVERERAARQRKRDAEESTYRERADKAAHAARAMWEGAALEGQSSYLVRKGVQGHGVRYLADGTLLVPMRDAAGELQNVQRVAAVKPADGSPEKRFLPGGRKTGLTHWCGEPAGAAVLLLAEGYATAASLHEATGRPVAVAFDAGNLVHVTRALRAQWPAASLLVCGDDDSDTHTRTGKNPGREKAAAAARAVDSENAPAGAVFPDGMSKGGSDFNDLAVQAGSAAVLALIDAAVLGLASGKARQATTRAAKPRKPTGEGNGSDGVERGPTEGSSGSAGGDGPPRRDAFTVTDEGVWFSARDNEGNDKPPVWLCSRLDIDAQTRADDANGWGYLLRFTDPDGNPKIWAMPSSMLSGEGAEWAGRLRDMGLRMAPGPRYRNLVAQYIDTRNPQERVTCTDRVGWHGPVFVLPSGTIGTAEGRRYVFQSEVGMEDTFRRSGELAQWRESVAELCVDNSRLAFAVCCAFAGPMLRLAEVESGGVHFRGDSSQGKTTALKVAASVWGRPSYMQRWRTTDNALEATAVQHSDCLLILDEFGQLDPRVAGECAYMLANDQEKGRATRGGLSRKRSTWRLLFLSSGEVSLAQHMEAVAKTPRAGQEVRMLDIPLDAGAGMGGLEALHGHDGPAALADGVTSAAARFYGTPGRTWLEWACANHATLPQRLVELVARYREDMVPAAASEQVRRAGTRFALIAAAGELAGEAGITGWLAGQAAWSARQCFNAWLAARGHLDNGEDASMIRQVRRFLELNGEGRFTWWDRAMDDKSPRTLNRAGFRRHVDAAGKPLHLDAAADYMDARSLPESSERRSAQVAYIVLREVFSREVCQGFDSVAVARLLQRHGHLVHEKDRLTDKQRLPGIGLAACYHIRPSIFCDDL